MIPQLRWVDPAHLAPNPWNPNAMDREMYAKAIASIREFGFIDPITVRDQGPFYEIIDGEHRWRAAKDESLATIPIVDLGSVEDDVARQLTIVLNETRGMADPQKLGTLLRDLSSRMSKEALLATLPYTREAFDRLSGLESIDWSSLTPPRASRAVERPSPWVERIFRMPKEAAETVDRAIHAYQESEGDGISDWQALEAFAADYLS